MVEIVQGNKGTLKDCERILRSLPEWFGIEESTQEYLAGIDLDNTFFAQEESSVIGFISLKFHFEKTAELYVLGVLPEWHHKGVGTQLYAAVERYLESHDFKMVTVKTLGPTREDKNYSATRNYYISLGFVPLEELSGLWGEGNPCLYMAKSIG